MDTIDKVNRRVRKILAMSKSNRSIYTINKKPQTAVWWLSEGRVSEVFRCTIYQCLLPPAFPSVLEEISVSGPAPDYVFSLHSRTTAILVAKCPSLTTEIMLKAAPQIGRSQQWDQLRLHLDHVFVSHALWIIDSWTGSINYPSPLTIPCFLSAVIFECL